MSLDAALHAHLALSAVLSSSTGGAFVCIFWSLWGWFLLKLGFKADYTSIICHCLPTRANPKERWLGFVRLLNPRWHCEGLALLLALCSSDEARSCGVHRRLIVSTSNRYEMFWISISACQSSGPSIGVRPGSLCFPAVGTACRLCRSHPQQGVHGQWPAATLGSILPTHINKMKTWHPTFSVGHKTTTSLCHLQDSRRKVW